MSDEIILRIVKSLGDSNIIQKLGSLSAKDFQSLMLYVYGERAESWDITDLLRQYGVNRFVSPCKISQRDLTTFDHFAYQILPDDYEALELSPLAPFGTNKVLAGTDQKNIMSTVRNVEVNADTTTALALECAKRRSELISLKLSSDNDVNLAASQRNIRLQNFEDIPGFSSHFKVFALTSAGESVGFETKVLGEHMSFYLQLLQALEQNGYFFQDVTLHLSDIRIAEAIIRKCKLDREKVGRETQNPNYDLIRATGLSLPSHTQEPGKIPPEIDGLKIEKPLASLGNLEPMVATLREEFEFTKIDFDLQRIAGIGYYPGICFKLVATNQEGDTYPLVDGGFTNWTKILLSSKKEKLLMSGIGTEIVCRNFKTG